MNNIVFLGAPGAGKGTLAAILKEKLHVPHISTGDLFRDNMKKHTPLGEQAEAYIQEGKLVPDEVTEAMLRDRLERQDCADGFILDGFPRNLSQAAYLDQLLADQSKALTAVVLVDVPEKVLLDRLTGRRVCPECQATYHVLFAPPEKEGFCDRCGARIIQREDDQEKTIRHRLEVYRENTFPLIHFYEEKGLLGKADNSEGEAEDHAEKLYCQLMKA